MNVHVSKAFENLKGCWWTSLGLNGISTRCLLKMMCNSSEVAFELNDMRFQGLEKCLCNRGVSNVWSLSGLSAKKFLTGKVRSKVTFLLCNSPRKLSDIGFMTHWQIQRATFNSL